MRSLLALTLVLVAHGAAQDRPNFVVLFADDLGYCDTDLYDCNEIPTPNIRRIAEEGVLFTDGYVTAGTCSPSRAGLLTGRYQQRFGFEFNTGPARITEDDERGLPLDETTVADALRKQGYATGMVGKWHQGTRPRFHPQKRGFDEFFGFYPGARPFFDQPADGSNAATNRVTSEHRRSGVRDISNLPRLSALYRGSQRVSEPEYLTDAFAREANAFIDRHRDEPFFLYVPFNAPHTPIEATQEYFDRFADAGMDQHRQVYAAMVSGLDSAVGRILDHLEELSLSERTLVWFLSDNGCAVYTEACTNDPLRLGKLYLFEGGVRIPFALRYPAAIDAGQVYRHPVSSLDIYPTLAALAGAEHDASRDGVDLLPHLTGLSENPPHSVLYWRNGGNKAIREGKWKLFWNERRDWLFDLSGDPGEAENVAGKRPEDVRRLKQIYDEWESELVDPAWPARSGRAVEVDGVKVDINI